MREDKANIAVMRNLSDSDVEGFPIGRRQLRSFERLRPLAVRVGLDGGKGVRKGRGVGRNVLLLRDLLNLLGEAQRAVLSLG